MNSILRFGLAVAMVLSTNYNAGAQQVANLENFEATTWLPTGWSTVGVSSNRWSRLSSSTFPTVAIGKSGIGFCRFLARGAANNTIQTLALPVADFRMRGSATPHISFYMYRDSLSKNADSIGVYINTVASLTGAVNLGTIARYSRLKMPDTQIVNGWYLYSFNVPPAFKGATNYLMIKGYSQGGNSSNNIYLDSVWWDTYPQVCSGKPTGSYITSNPDPICGGSGTAALTLNGNVATYTGITITWQWSTTSSGPWTTFGNNSTSATTGTINISRFYRCILACSASSQSDTSNVYVMRVISTPKPTIVVTPNPVTACTLGGPTLMVASGAKTYSWTPPTGLNVANKDSVYTSTTNNTTYTVVGTDSQGCSGTTNVTVTVRTSPNVTITSLDSQVCLGDSIRLVAQGGGITQYLWAPGGQTLNNIWAKPTVDTKYIVAVKNNFNCSNTASKTIRVKQPPVAKFGYTNNGNVFHFADSSTGGQSWHWQFGDGNESYKQNPVYTFSGDTNYSVTLIVSDPPCKNDSFTTIIRGNPLFAGNLQVYPVLVSPNPAGSYTEISVNGAAITGKMRLMDATGRDVTGLADASNSGTSTRLNLSRLPQGMYFIHAEVKGHTYTGRLMRL